MGPMLYMQTVDGQNFIWHISTKQKRENTKKQNKKVIVTLDIDK